MNTPAINPGKSSNNAGFPPVPPEAHQRKGVDFKQEVTNKIITLIEKEGLAWTKAWASNAAGIPINGSTGNYYNGMNIMLFMIEAFEKGYGSNIWMTFKQALDMGGHVRKGEKGTRGLFYSLVEKDAKENKPEEEKDYYHMIKNFIVFNACQIEGIEFQHEIVNPNFSRIEAAESLLTASGAKISNCEQDRAFYNHSIDEIRLPLREQFTQEAKYYSVAFHELTHWTGSKTRLDRDMGSRSKMNQYAMEELVAEIGSAFFTAHLGLEKETIENHAAYIDEWLSVLRHDKNAIFSAASQASRAFDFVVKNS